MNTTCADVTLNVGSQARAVLAILSGREPDFADYDAERQRYVQALIVAFGECRSGDDIFVDAWVVDANDIPFNAPTHETRGYDRVRGRPGAYQSRKTFPRCASVLDVNLPRPEGRGFRAGDPMSQGNDRRIGTMQKHTITQRRPLGPRQQERAGATFTAAVLRAFHRLGAIPREDVLPLRFAIETKAGELLMRPCPSESGHGATVARILNAAVES